MKIYKNGFSSIKEGLSKNTLLKFFKLSNKFLDHSIAANKRSDNLYHAYNLMTVENDKEISISYMEEMLEGQVAVLSSGYLSPEQSLELLNSLKISALFRSDQYSYLLYPNISLTNFMEKNNIPEQEIKKSGLLIELLQDGNTQIIEKDILGQYHFNGSFNNSDSLNNALSELRDEKYLPLIEKDKEHLLNVFEDIFDHKSFTGRSRTFFGYEGLGSIYWHMVSKLLLAVQENCLEAIDNKESNELIGKLMECYYEINEGIGVHKSPELYGAFPIDPYSHTPATKGAQQPGLTGQVKEDILSRYGELGIFIKNGKLSFKPNLLRRGEFLKSPSIIEYTDVNLRTKKLNLDIGSLFFTYCQVPIVYKLSDMDGLKVFYRSEDVKEQNQTELDHENSAQIFERLGLIDRVEVYISDKSNNLK
jgi:hypothetical protein